MKKCGRCSDVKKRSEFYTCGTKKPSHDGLAGWCKECRRSDERERRRDPVVVGKFHARYETDMDFRARELLRAIGKRCRSKGHAFDLDIPWLSERLSGRCELTGLPFDLSVAARRSTAFSPSVDRIVPANGYTKANCRVVLYALNVAMSDWGLAVTVDIAAALLREQARWIGLREIA
jgi:hypothetical protein